jgi:hypothetical protein
MNAYVFGGLGEVFLDGGRVCEVPLLWGRDRWYKKKKKEDLIAFVFLIRDSILI